MSGLLSLEEAQRRLLALAPETCVSMQPIAQTPSHKRYLASDIAALRTQPAADLSAMDGYALASGRGPWEIVGESRAGAPFERSLGTDQCVRIATGAHMPDGGDRVLIQENAEIEGDRVLAAEPPPPGCHVRRAGFDFREGETILAKGVRWTPGMLALAAAAGHHALPCRKPPGVAVLESGDELAPLGRKCAAHQIPASNGLMIAAMIEPHVGPVKQIGPVGDNRDALADALKRGEDSHILVTSGGASVGDHDLVQQALRDWGAQIDFWKVAIKPGKPLLVATRNGERGRQVIVGLPGNPASSFVTAFLFVLPLIRATMGSADPLPRKVTLHAGEEIPAGGPRREFLRAVHDGSTVSRAGLQDSSGLTSLAQANCLIERPENAGPVAAGDAVAVYLLQND